MEAAAPVMHTVDPVEDPWANGRGLLLNRTPNSVEARDVASLIHPQTNLAAHSAKGPHVISKGEGVYVYDNEGKKYLESASGLWCASLGFANERLAKAAYEQMRILGFYHVYWHNTHERGIELAEALLKLAPVPMARVLFQCSGSEANDTAIKLAWYYWNSRGQPERRKIIGRRMGYHGSTVATTSASGKADMHQDFNLPLAGFIHTDFPHFYRFGRDNETEENYASRLAENLDALIKAEGPETIAAFIAEPVIGAGGAVTPPKTYFEKVQSVLKQHDILFIVDEVICGFGRTGEMWGTQTYSLMPDIITCAKALSAGMQPISAILIGERLHEAMLSQSRKLGSFAHGSTYSGHPVAAAVALEVLAIYEEMDLLNHVHQVGTHLQNALEQIRDHPLVGDVSGVGLLAGVELMRDKEVRVPFAPSERVGALVMDLARENGLLVRAIGDRVALSPPIIINEREIDQMVALLRATLDQVSATVKAR